MSITITGDNAQIPSMVSEIYNPDQLVGGRYPIETAEDAMLEGTAVLKRGAVLGQATLPTFSATAGANTGTGTVSQISLAPGGAFGNYTLTATSATDFNVTAPNGDNLGVATVGTQFNDIVSFLITAGTTAFVAGDTFTLSALQPSGYWKLSVSTATDGSQNPAGILASQSVDPTSGPVGVAVYIAGEFNVNAINFDGSWTKAALVPKCRASNIYLRNSVSAAPPTSNA